MSKLTNVVFFVGTRTAIMFFSTVLFFGQFLVFFGEQLKELCSDTISFFRSLISERSKRLKVKPQQSTEKVDDKPTSDSSKEEEKSEEDDSDSTSNQDEFVEEKEGK